MLKTNQGMKLTIQQGANERIGALDVENLTLSPLEMKYVTSFSFDFHLLMWWLFTENVLFVCNMR